MGDDRETHKAKGFTTSEIITVYYDVLAFLQRTKDVEVHCFIIPQSRSARGKRVQLQAGASQSGSRDLKHKRGIVKALPQGGGEDQLSGGGGERGG